MNKQQIPQNEKKMFKGIFYNNKELYEVSNTIAFTQVENMEITEKNTERNTLLTDFFHDLFQIQASIVAKHLLSIFKSSLNFVINEAFKENQKVCLIDLKKIYLERDSNREILRLFYSFSKESEIECSEYFTQHQALIINLYLQINLMSMCILSKDADEDDDRQYRIIDHKERNTKYIEVIQQIIREKVSDDTSWKAIVQKIKANCDSVCAILQKTKLKYKTKGLAMFIQILFNYIKNFTLSYLMTDQAHIIGEENIRWDKLKSINNSSDLYNELMTIDKVLKDSMTLKPLNLNDYDMQGQPIQMSISDELRYAAVIIDQDYNNQQEQKTKQFEKTTEKMKKTKALIEQIFQKNQDTIFNSVLSENKQQYAVTFKMFNHWDHFLDICIIKLTKDSFRCTIHFCKENYEPIIIPDKITRTQVSRLFIKKVSKIGGFVINPLSGQITFSYCTHNHLSKYTGDEFDTFLNRVIKSIFTSAYYMINYYLLSIFVKIGLISIPIYKDIEIHIKNCQERGKKEKTLLLPENMIRRLNNTIDLLENSTKPFTDFKNDELYIERIMAEDKVEIEKQLEVKSKIQDQSQSDSQLEEFQVVEYDEKKLKRISGGGFSEIYAIDLQFKLKKKENISQYGFQDQQNQGIYSTTFALKVQRKDVREREPKEQREQREQKEQRELRDQRDEKKIEKEVQIIREIKPKCKYVARYFYDETKPDHLFMELYYFTLGSYAHFHNSVMSLNTRLLMTLQVAQGVKFLQEIDIYHLDLKPPNILLDDELQIKICDFGESYCKAIHKEVSKFNKTGRTLPYSPIESLTGNNFSSASDVYSIGAIISEIIFDKRLIEFKRINQQKLQQKLIQRNYRLIYSDLVIKEFGIKQIMKILKVLMFKCVNPEPTCRPHVEYIISILYMLIKVLNELY